MSTSLAQRFYERAAQTPAGAPGRCVWCDPRTWVELPEPPRKGYVRTVCGKCGAWIGDRRTDGKQPQQLDTEQHEPEASEA